MSTPSFLYPSGVATQAGAYIIVRVIHPSGQMLDGNLFVDYRGQPNPEGFGRDWSAVHVCLHPPSGDVFAVGSYGEILRISDPDIEEDRIAPAQDGPDEHGPIREIRSIGGQIYAVGMGRQVYRRVARGGWDRLDDGMLDRSGRATVGLNSMVDSDSGLVAVGYEGEIWELDQRWRRIDSPTNVLLTRVVRHRGTLYAAGVLGTLLCRDAQGWRVVETSDFDVDIWDVEVFGGTLYLGTQDGLFRLDDDDEIVPVEIEESTGQRHCGWLSSNAERLWCFGGEKVSSSADGVTWREERIFALDAVPPTSPP
jgi:hypothetical protein